jgi:hypothetical protein
LIRPFSPLKRSSLSFKCFRWPNGQVRYLGSVLGMVVGRCGAIASVERKVVAMQQERAGTSATPLVGQQARAPPFFV